MSFTRIESRVPRADYDAVQGVSITKLKELRRSPQHYQYLLSHPKQSGPLTLGITSHIAVLEPDRFAAEFATWERTTTAGKMAPRNGQYWEAFCLENPGRTVLTPAESRLAQAIAKAVRSDPTAMKYLEVGDPEVTLLWDRGGRQCKGRADWLTTLGHKPYLVGLKTARDCRTFAFGAQAARLDYALQWAWYFDGYEAITGTPAEIREIVVESSPPHAVATYIIDRESIVAQGRDNYLDALRVLDDCEKNGEWPGPVLGEQVLTLPTWYFPQLDDDLGELGLEV